MALFKKKTTKKEPEVVNETIEGNKRIVMFDDGSELVWKELESRRAVFNLNAADVPSFNSDRIELEGGILTENDNKISYIHDGIKIFEIGSRKKAYKEMKEWCGCNVIKLIAEKRSGDYGDYYTVWAYFHKK